MICGFIMLFSTIVAVINVLGLYPVLAAPFELLFRVGGVDPDLVRAAVAGLLEIDLGTLAASKAPAGLVHQVAVAGAIIAWSGLSVFGQVASVLSGTDIRLGPYFVARALHAVLAFTFTIIFMQAAGSGGFDPGPVLPALGGLPERFGQPGFWEYLTRGLTWAVGIPLGLVLAGTVAAAATGGLRWLRLSRG